MSFSHKRKASRLVCWASLLISFALLIIPSFAGFMDLDYLATVDENRVFAPPPSWPANWTEFLALPRQVDNYLRDHFGFRAYLLQANANARYALFNETPTPQTIFGHDGRLFLTTHDKASPYSLMSDICGARLPPAVIGILE